MKKLLKRLFYVKIGYIVLTNDRGENVLINTRSILRYYPYTNPWTPSTRTRLIYLDHKELNLKDTYEDINKLISECL
jgi:hypothetical protein